MSSFAWIRVQDMVPEYGQIVLTCDKDNNVVTAQLGFTDLAGHHWYLAFDREDSGNEWEDVLYWAPCPEAPLVKAPAGESVS